MQKPLGKVRRECLGQHALEQIEFDPERVYCGRWNQGKWGNPFPVRDFPSLEACLEAYRDHLRRRPELQAAMREELPGKVLVCHCGLDKACHVDIIAEVVNGTFE